MATANVRNVIRMPARLAINPTNLLGAFPHGGTALGLARDLVFNYGYRTDIATAEEYGGVVTRAFYAGERPYVAAVLREFDNDAISNIFPNSTVGTVSGNRYVTFTPNAGNRPGYDLTGKTYKLAICPISSKTHPFVIIYYAMPALAETAKLNASLNEEVGIGVVFWAGLNSGNQCYAHGRAEDLQPVL